jgi:hypothetical protein
MAQPRLDDLIDRVKSLHPDGDPLDRLADAVVVSGELDELADHLVGHFVDQARRAGASWTEIGASMGVTKQAAQKRFVPRPEGPLDGGMLSRFTKRAATIVKNSQEIARGAQNDTVEPEHLLLALLADPEALATQAAVAVGASLESARAAAVAAFPAPADEPPSGHIPFSARSKKLLQLTARKALGLGHNYVGTEHMLLGLLDDPSSPEAQLLANQGVTNNDVLEYIKDTLTRLQKARKP